MRNIMSRWVLASALGAVALTQASASIVFHFNTVHSGAVPVGSASWAVMTMNDIPGGVQISLTNNATNPTGQFIGQLNLLFTPQPTGSNFSSDPYVQSISLGNFTDAGLGFNEGGFQETRLAAPTSWRDFHFPAVRRVYGELCRGERQRDGAYSGNPAAGRLRQDHRA